MAEKRRGRCVRCGAWRWLRVDGTMPKHQSHTYHPVAYQGSHMVRECPGSRQSPTNTQEAKTCPSTEE